MKKILAIFVAAAVAGSASAASIDWTISNGAATLKDSTGAKMTGTAYLILESSLSSIESSLSGSISGFTSAMSTYALTSTEISAGKASPVSGTATHASLEAGTTKYKFAFLIFDSAHNQYYVSSSSEQYAYDATSDDPSLAVPTSISFDRTLTGATTGTNPSTQTFKPAIIPEPSVALMGLLGLGMLLKRRRA